MVMGTRAQIGIENAAAFQSPGHSVDGDGNNPNLKICTKTLNQMFKKAFFSSSVLRPRPAKTKIKRDRPPRGGNIGSTGAEQCFGEENGRRSE